MKKMIWLICMTFLATSLATSHGALAHQENHVHSQWLKQQFGQLYQKIDKLTARIDQLEGRGAAGSTSGNRQPLSESCSSREQKLCSKTCLPGWKIEKATCMGRGNIGKTYHSERGVTCYCYNENDPYCGVKSITATCTK